MGGCVLRIQTAVEADGLPAGARAAEVDLYGHPARIARVASRNAYGDVVATVEYARRRMRARLGYYGFVSDGGVGVGVVVEARPAQGVAIGAAADAILLGGVLELELALRRQRDVHDRVDAREPHFL